MENYYELLSNYMLRVPVQEIKFEEANSNLEQNFTKLKENKIFMEQLYVASSSLYDFVRKNDELDFNNKKQRNILVSLLSYMNRASFRTTPFGLFSAVTLKEFSGKISSQPNNLEIKKVSRIDLDWLFGILRNLELENYFMFNFQVNSATYSIGDRVILPYNTGENLTKIDIRKTKPFECIWELAQKRFVSFNELLSNLQQKYPDRDKNILQNYLLNLIRKEFLISDLRPPIVNNNELSYLINKLESYGSNSDMREVVQKLREIEASIMKFNKIEIGQGIQIYQEIKEKMSRMYSLTNDNYLQIDSQVMNLESVITYRDTKNIDMLATYLVSLIALDTNNQNKFEKYYQEFIEKYGEHQEVKLTDMLDETIGIGVPSFYDEDEKEQDTLKRYFLEKYRKAVQQNTFIDLSANDFNLSEFNIDRSCLPTSLELSFIPRREENEKIVFTLGPNMGSERIGKNFGRFSHMSVDFESVIKDSETCQFDKEAEDYFSCELSFIPFDVRSGNVARTKSFKQKNLALYTTSFDIEHEILLKDINVGMDNGRLYLRDSVTNEKIQVSMNHMLNTMRYSNEIRMMVDISIRQDYTWANLLWEKYYQEFSYVPEIRFKNIVLVGEKWRIFPDNPIFKMLEKFDIFKQELLKIKEEERIPNRVYLQVADHKILLDLTNDLYLKILQKNFMRSPTIELISEERGKPVLELSNGITHNAEIVTMLKLKKQKNLPVSSVAHQPYYDFKYMPMNKWVYLKLYGAKSRQEELLEYLHFFCTEKIKESESFFFIRYLDPKPHIRLRIKSKEIPQILSIFNEFAKSLIENTLISRYSIHTYIPEKERYGGIELIEIAEENFCSDSRIIMEILEKDTNLTKETMGITALFHYFDIFMISYDEQVLLLNSFVSTNDFIDEFQKDKKMWITIFDPHKDWLIFNENENRKNYLNLLREREQSLIDYREKIAQCDAPSNNMQSIIGSLFHMHCNRLFGVDRELENKILVFTALILKNQKYERGQIEKSHEKKYYK